MLRALFRTALVVGLLAAVLACARPPAPPGLAGPVPQRIVSLTPALTEILFAVGAGDRVVGVTQFCDFPPAAKAKPKVGGYVNPSVESVLALKPDLVVVSPGPGNRDSALAMQRAGLRLEIVPAETLEESLAAIEGVARVVGVEATGRELARSVRARIDAVAKRVLAAPRVRDVVLPPNRPDHRCGTRHAPFAAARARGGSNVIARRTLSARRRRSGRGGSSPS